MSGVVRATLLRGRIAKVGNGNVLFQKPGVATVMTESGVVEMLNRMSDAEWIERLSRCCSSTAWCDGVVRRRGATGLGGGGRLPIERICIEWRTGRLKP